MKEFESEREQLLNYEEERKILKFGEFNSAILIFQQCVGVSLFSLQKALQMVGVIWGGFLTLVGCYLTTYGLILLSVTAGEIEEELRMEKRIKNLDELASHIDYKHIKIVKWSMMFCGICIMIASSVTNIFMVASYLESAYKLDILTTRIIIFVVISIMLLYVIEPERIQFLTYFTTTAIISVAFICLIHNYFLFFTGSGATFADIPMVNFENTGTFCGNMAYAYELAAGYLSLRLISSINVNYNKVTLYMLSFIGFNYFICAASYLFAYRQEDIKESAFDMFVEQKSVLRHFIYMLMFNNICTYIGNVIFTSEMLETIPLVERAIIGGDGIIHRAKITAFRISIWGFMVFVSYFSTNIIEVLNFTGSGFTPIVSYFGPLYYYYAHSWSRKREVSKERMIHDAVYLVVALIYSVWGIVDLF